MEGTITFLVSLASAIVFILFWRSIADRVGLVDHPGGRKRHNASTPLVGGVAVYSTLIVSWLFLGLPADCIPFLAACTVLLIVGLTDDIREVSPAFRFLAQFIAILIMIYWADIRLENLGALFTNAPIHLGIMAVPFTVFAGVGVINATNMLDGLDGLAGSIMLIFFAILLVLALNNGLLMDASILLVLCATLIAFLVFNFRFTESRPASIFMGDGGTLFIGLAAAWFLIKFSQEPHNIVNPMTAVWLLGLPIMDTVAIMIRRIRRGRSPFAPDREHFHHILLLAGFSVRNSVLIIIGISLVFSLIGLTGQWLGIPEWAMFYSYILLSFFYFRGMCRAWKIMRLLHAYNEARSESSDVKTEVSD